VFLRFAVGSMKEHGYELANLDSTVHLERPKLRPYIDRIRESLSVALEVEMNCVSVKAKTGEGVDAVGEMKAVKAEAVVLLLSVLTR
jgi:2-C-methyl-D-erythritol 2,4-cyclodiphosphate synthase